MSTELITTASIEIQSDEVPSSKTLHLLKIRLQDALNVAVLSTLDELGIPSTSSKPVRLDTIEVVSLEDVSFSD